MQKYFKCLIGILLLPVCIGSFRALLWVIGQTTRADSIWVALLAGATCWWVIYILLPKPMWVYVVGHELTHAIWTWAFGGKVKRFRASASGGHVVVTKANFLITLAPYFFPLYALLVVVGFFTLQLLTEIRDEIVWFHLLLGAAYSFHVTLTWHALKTRQSDVVENGYLFSAAVIWLGNVAGLLIGVPLVTRQVSVSGALASCWIETTKVFRLLSAWI